MKDKHERPSSSGFQLIRGEKTIANKLTPKPKERLAPPIVPASPHFTITLPWNSVTFYKGALFVCGVLVGVMLDHSENHTLFIGLDDVLLGVAALVIFKLAIEESIPKKFRDDADSDPDWDDGVD